METLLSIDWISVTSHGEKSKTYTAYPALHDWENWTMVNGQNGYNLGAKHITTVRSYESSVRPDMGKHVIYSATALKRIQVMYNVTPVDILKYHVESGHNIARLDIAIDFINCSVDVGQFTDAFMNGECRTRLRSASQIKSLTERGETLYIGSKKKRKNLVRIYDKGAETNTDENWTRVELQVMGKKATGIAIDISTSESIEHTMLGIVRNIIDFPTIGIWKQLMDGIIPVEMTVIPKEQGKTEKWLIEQVAPALARVIIVNFEFWTQFKLALWENLPESMHDDTM